MHVSCLCKELLQQLVFSIVYVMILHSHIEVVERLNDACDVKHPHWLKDSDIIDVYVQSALHVEVGFTSSCTVGIIEASLFTTVILKE
jgi:hypothetical protein